MVSSRSLHEAVIPHHSAAARPRRRRLQTATKDDRPPTRFVHHQQQQQQQHVRHISNDDNELNHLTTDYLLFTPVSCFDRHSDAVTTVMSANCSWNRLSSILLV